MGNVNPTTDTFNISDEALTDAAKAAQDRYATDVIPVIRKYVPAPAKLKDCPVGQRPALLDELNWAGCPADALPIFTKLAEVAGDTEGMFVIVGLHNTDPRPIVIHVPNEGEVLDGLTKAAATIASNLDYGIHIAPALFRTDLPEGKRGGKGDVTHMLAIVVEFDREHDPATRRDRLAYEPWCENESSPGNFHCWRFLDKPYPIKDVVPLLAAVHVLAKADSTKNPDHLFRLPGSINIPTEEKIRTGKREPGMVRAKLHLSDPGLADMIAPPMSLGALRAAIINEHGSIPVVEAKADDSNFGWSLRATAFVPLTADQIRNRLDKEVGGSKRSRGMSKGYAMLRNQGYSPEEIFECITDHSDTVLADKALKEKGEGWLRDDIKRWWLKQKPITSTADTFSEFAETLEADDPGNPGSDDTLDEAMEKAKATEAELGGPDAKFTREVEERERKRLADLLHLFNENFAIASMGHSTRKAVIVEFVNDGKTLKFMEVKDFVLRFKPLTVWIRSGTGNPKWAEVSQLWLKWSNRRHYLTDGLVFAPGRPLEWPGGLNRWRGFAIEPKKGDWTSARDLIERVLCGGNTELSEYTLNWLAHLVQRPGVLTGSSIVFRSEHEGAGKGTLGRTIGSFFGLNYTYIQRGGDFTGRFNGSLAETLFAVLDEAMYAGDYEASETLKTLVSDQERRSEQKNLPVEYITNHINFMVFGNNDWLVRTGLKNRRFVYLNVPEVYAPNDAYWDQFHAEQDRPGHPGVKWKLPPMAMRQAMLHDLLHRDISTFNPRAIPHTKEEGHQKLLSMSGVQGFVHAILTEGEIEFPIPHSTTCRPWGKDGLTIRRADFLNAVRHYRSQQNERGQGPTSEQIGRALKRLLKGCVRDARPRDVTVNPGFKRCYTFAPLAQCREAFAQGLGSPLTWEDMPTDDVADGTTVEISVAS